MTTPTILVTGANGQLGTEIKEISASFPSYHFEFFDSASFPIQDKAIGKRIFEKYRPEFFINAAAYTAVDKAESEKELAEIVNGIAVGYLSTLCNQFNTKLIHISTDYVFDGSVSKPLQEQEPVNPVNHYGASKLLGEQLAMQNSAATLIIRTSWVYSSFGKNFVKTMIRLMKHNDRIQVVNDQVGSPTYAADLANAILQIVDSGKWIPGIYNYSNDGVISWYEFACEIGSIIHSSCIIQPITTEQYPTPAVRPKNSLLDKTKIQHVYHVGIKNWRESLQICLSKLTLSDAEISR